MTGSESLTVEMLDCGGFRPSYTLNYEEPSNLYIEKVSYRMRRRLNIVLFLICASLWVISVFAEFVKYNILSLGCPTSSDSIFGKSGWSIIPFGHTCEWELASGVSAITYPSLSSLLPPIFLLLWGSWIVLSRENPK